MIDMGLNWTPFSSDILGHATSTLCDSVSSVVKKSVAIFENRNTNTWWFHLLSLSQIAVQKTEMRLDSYSLFFFTLPFVA